MLDSVEGLVFESDGDDLGKGSEIGSFDSSAGVEAKGAAVLRAAEEAGKSEKSAESNEAAKATVFDYGSFLAQLRKNKKTI